MQGNRRKRVLRPLRERKPLASMTLTSSSARAARQRSMPIAPPDGPNIGLGAPSQVKSSPSQVRKGTMLIKILYIRH